MNNSQNHQGEMWYAAKYVKAPIGTSGGNLEVWIDLVMPDIPMGLPTSWPFTLVDAIYNNCDSCKPAISSIITLQNYHTATAAYAHEAYAWPRLSYGSTLEVETRDTDCLTFRLRAIDVDPSFI